MNQEQMRNVTSTSALRYAPPQNQGEAKPPAPRPRSSLQAQQQTELDPAMRHPVFFTDRLKKAPVGVSSGGGLWSSPVAKGYVFNDGARREDGGVKL